MAQDFNLKLSRQNVSNNFMVCEQRQVGIKFQPFGTCFSYAGTVVDFVLKSVILSHLLSQIYYVTFVIAANCSNITTPLSYVNRLIHSLKQRVP
jgi:hypothetical protein